MDFQKPENIQEPVNEEKNDAPQDLSEDRLYFTIPARKLRMERRRSGH